MSKPTCWDYYLGTAGIDSVCQDPCTDCCKPLLLFSVTVRFPVVELCRPLHMKQDQSKKKMKDNRVVGLLCLTLRDSMGCRPPVSSIHGILQAIILEWAAIPSSRGSSWPMDQTWVSCIAGGFFAIWATSIYTFPCVFIRCLPFLSFYIFYLFFWLR